MLSRYDTARSTAISFIPKCRRKLNRLFENRSKETPQRGVRVSATQKHKRLMQFTDKERRKGWKGERGRENRSFYSFALLNVLWEWRARWVEIGKGAPLAPFAAVAFHSNPSACRREIFFIVSQISHRKGTGRFLPFIVSAGRKKDTNIRILINYLTKRRPWISRLAKKRRWSFVFAIVLDYWPRNAINFIR